MRTLAVCLVVACGPPKPPPKPPPLLENVTTVVHAKRLLDVTSGIYLDNAMVALRDDRIAFTGHWEPARVPSGVEVIDLGDSVLMPGMVDAHVHLAWGAATDGVPGAEAAATTLRVGFTTVRDLGSTENADLVLRDAIASGQIIGPRMHVAGYGLGRPGGACDRVFGPAGRVTTLDEGRRAVHELAKAGATVIKICTGGDVLPGEHDRDAVELDEKIVKAIVDAAGAHGMRVAAHAQGPQAIGIAVRGGVASIEHGGLLDDKTIAEMRAHGTVLVPTLARLDHAMATAPARERPAIAESRKLAYASARKAAAAGVKIVMGTDATVLPHGDNARELVALVEIGLEPAAAIRAATIDAAALMGANGEIGTLAAGKRADIIAVQGDPLRDVSALRKVVFVMKAGDVIRNDLR